MSRKEKMNTLHLEYQSSEPTLPDWHNLIAVGLMVGGGGGHVATGLLAIYDPQPLLWFPLIGSLALLIVGVVWWLLNRRGLS